MAGRRNVALAVAAAALGLALVGTAQAAARAGSTEIGVSLMDGGKVMLSKSSLPAGKLTLVVVNKGKQTHGLAIMGNGLSPKRTPALGVGKTARLVVTVKAGMYHLWDPVRSSMSHARFLTVKAPSGGGGMGDMGGSSGGSTGGSSGGSSGGGGMDDMGMGDGM